MEQRIWLKFVFHCWRAFVTKYWLNFTAHLCFRFHRHPDTLENWVAFESLQCNSLALKRDSYIHRHFHGYTWKRIVLKSIKTNCKKSHKISIIFIHTKIFTWFAIIVCSIRFSMTQTGHASVCVWEWR